MEEWICQQSLQDVKTRRCISFSPLRARRWSRPAENVLKCNLHSSWRTASAFGCGAWVLRNSNGDALFHGRDAFLPTVNRIVAELQCIVWGLQSLKDLGVLSCEVWSDCNAAILAIEKPLEWPKYQSLLAKVDINLIH
ncbi:hypothetical protein CARUB_v10006704mg [Capsella rubella]|uniref:RNase H type-1 domain-containing protein n=1 Tax=Capsella rubella TaxID=81985 RepID=R0GG49_9BRAS|nr:hypothetical protein CARUB_v10006704mg [Capsella rubella]